MLLGIRGIGYSCCWAFVVLDIRGVGYSWYWAFVLLGIRVLLAFCVVVLGIHVVGYSPHPIYQ